MPSGIRAANKQPRAVKGSQKLFEIGEVIWTSESGQLAIRMSDSLGVVEVLFDAPVSFRSQDEGDMLEYWGGRSDEQVEVATMYTIDKSDYLSGFLGKSVSSFNGDLRHWLIAGNNQCVEVISYAEDIPTMNELERFKEQ